MITKIGSLLIPNKEFFSYNDLHSNQKKSSIKISKKKNF